MGTCVAYISAVGLIVVPAADDYCSMAATRAAAFSEFIRDFYTGFNGRFASGVVTGIVYNFGISGFMLVSPLALITLFLVLTYAFAPLSRLLFDDFPGRSLVVPAGLIIGLFTVGSSPTRLPYEYLHWLPGIITYTLPLALIALMWRFVLGSRFAARHAFWRATIVFSASVFLATFHEFVGVFNAGIACLILIIEYLLRRPLRQPLLRTLAVIVGSGAGLLTIYFSPGIEARRAALAAILKRDIPLSEAVQDAAKDVVILGQSFQSWEGALAIAVAATVGMVAYVALRPRWQQMLRTGGLTSLGAAILVGALVFVAALWGVASVSRHYYGGVVPDRMLVYPYLFLVVELGLVGAVVAAQLWGLLGQQQVAGYAALGLLVCVVSVGVWRATSTYWERVDQRRLAYQKAVSGIDEARRNGVLRIYSPWVIPGLGEAAPLPDHWLNRCQADYFEVPTVVGVWE